MKNYKRTPEERYQLILECRRSGLTDHQWCLQNGISPTSFYRWLKRFRAEGYPDLENTSKAQTASVSQEAVKVNIVSEQPDSHSVCNYGESLKQQSYSYFKADEVIPVIEIIRNDTLVRVSNSANPQLVDIILGQLGGAR